MLLKNSRYYSIFTDVYRIFCDYINGYPTGVYSEEWIKAASEKMDFLVMQYGDDKFVRGLCNACLSEMKRKYEYALKYQEEGKALPSGMTTNVKTSRYWRNFQDFWKFFEKYCNLLSSINPNDKSADSEFWNRACNDAHNLGYRAESQELNRLTQEFILAAMDELERLENKKKVA